VPTLEDALRHRLVPTVVGAAEYPILLADDPIDNGRSQPGSTDECGLMAVS
jgi:hypothetical protein